jgi:hypothetical protein
MVLVKTRHTWRTVPLAYPQKAVEAFDSARALYYSEASKTENVNKI